MTLLAPWALWFSIIAATVVALYLLKIKRRRQTVPALDFWRRLTGQTQVRSLFQRLKRWLSLALWLLIVACLILSIGNPVFSLGRIKPQSIVVILDNSASMQTREEIGSGAPASETQSRLALARKAVEDLTTRRPVSDEWLLIEAARQPRVLVAWTVDRKLLRDAAEAVEPYRGSSNLAAARELAGQLLAGKERPCIVIVSDGAAGAVEKLLKDDASIVHWPIGSTDNNLGITHLAVRTHREQATHYAYINVASAATTKIDSQIVFEIDGSTTAVEPLSIDAGGMWEKTVALNAPQGGVLRAWIDRHDALDQDNEAFAILQPIARASIKLVTPPDEAFFYEQALMAMESVVDPEASRTLSIEDYDVLPDAARRADMTIFNNCAPKALPPSGRFVFVNAWPREIPARIAGELEHPDLTIVQRDHPLCRYVTASGVGLARARQVELPERATVLAQSTGGAPLLFLCEQPDRTSLCIAFDVMESDLPFRNAFPLLLRNAVSYLAAQQAAWVREEYRIGDVIEPLRALPSGVRQVVVARLQRERSGATDPATVPVSGGTFLFEQTRQQGPLRFSIGDDTAYAAINLADAGETRIAPVKSARAPQEALALTGRLFGMVPWLGLAVMATLLVGFEWLTYHFRWTE